eukprot:TRINITY_DN9584_c0_g1_i1.p1 TRINITY_DN9584_c0_g1~~TRINITY_DN9584_c0_g1_i1.p1  ORF type:complete len:396 (-),score=79.93 TRINITY_DN9584_c0_g1_i1:73-1260(-)
MRIAFLHPDMGIGGAQQLEVNIAVAMQNQGHKVNIYTLYHNPDHAFKETVDGTLKVKVCKTYLPRSILDHRLIGLLAMIRMIIAAIYMVLYAEPFDVVMVDQVSACIPIFRLFGKKVIFYVHFPDKVFCFDRKGFFKKIYRFFLDLIEEVTTAMAHVILANSRYTRSVTYRCFPLLKLLRKQVEVVYPATDFVKFDEEVEDSTVGEQIKGEYFISLNRIHPEKNHMLAVRAFAEYKRIAPNSKEKLVIAGGYQERLVANRKYYEELLAEANKFGLQDSVVFIKNLSEGQRLYLLKHTKALLYPPESEPFGIVPVEAMYLRRPVLANQAGGPLESVVDGKTGFLLEPDARRWGEAMKILAEDDQRCEEMGEFGRSHVIKKFGMETLTTVMEGFFTS